MTPDQNSAGISAGSGELTITRDGNRIVIAGEIRTSTDREQLRTAVEHALPDFGAPGSELVLDVARAGYLDTAMLTSLLGLSRRCRDRKTSLVLAGANQETIDALRMTHIDRVLESHGARIEPVRAAE